MTNTMPVLTEEKRQALIYEAKFLIENHGGNLEELLKIALASLEAEKDSLGEIESGVRALKMTLTKCNRMNYCRGVLMNLDDVIAKAKDRVYTAPPVPALKLPDEWTFCPECGSEEIHYQEGNHKQCANCHQEWHSHINYSRAVKLNLQEFFRKANQPPVPAMKLPEPEKETGDLYASEINAAIGWNNCLEEVKRLNGVTE